MTKFLKSSAKGSTSGVKRLAVPVLALALVLLADFGVLAQTQKARPLSEADTTKRIEVQIGDDVVSARAEQEARARARERAEREAEARRLALLEEQERRKAEEEERAWREAEEQADLPPRVKALIEALQDEDASVRTAAAVSLEKMGAKAQGAVPALVERVADKKIVNAFGSDKDAALAALKALAPEKVEQALLDASKAKNPQVRRWATDRLGELDEGKPPRVKALVALIEALQDEDTSVRGTATVNLEKMGAKAQGAVPALVERVADERPGDLWVRIDIGKNGMPTTATANDKDNALAALKTIAPEKVEQALIDATKAKNPEVKRWATERLGELDGGK